MPDVWLRKNPQKNENTLPLAEGVRRITPGGRKYARAINPVQLRQIYRSCQVTPVTQSARWWAGAVARNTTSRSNGMADSFHKKGWAILAHPFRQQTR